MESGFKSLLPSHFYQPDFPYSSLFFPFSPITIISARISRFCDIFVTWGEVHHEKIRNKRINPNVIEEENRDKSAQFNAMGLGRGQYISDQKDYAINKAMSIGVRTTSKFFFRVSLTPNLSCAIISYVEIEVICLLSRRGKNHKGLGKISISKNYIPPLLKFQY